MGRQGWGQRQARRKRSPTAPEPIVDDTTINFCVNFDNLDSDRIRSDALSSPNHDYYDYCEDEVDVGARSGGPVGNANMYTFPKAKDRKKVLIDRTVYLDFSHVPVNKRPALPDPPYVDVSIRFRSRNFGALSNMPYPTQDYPSIVTDDTNVFRVSFEDNEGNSWRLAYVDEAYANPGCGGVDGTITRVDGFTWVITGQTACLVKEEQGTITKFGPVEMPFGMTWVDERWVEWLDSQP